MRAPAAQMAHRDRVVAVCSRRPGEEFPRMSAFMGGLAWWVDVFVNGWGRPETAPPARKVYFWATTPSFLPMVSLKSFTQSAEQRAAHFGTMTSCVIFFRRALSASVGSTTFM